MFAKFYSYFARLSAHSMLSTTTSLCAFVISVQSISASDLSILADSCTQNDPSVHAASSSVSSVAAVPTSFADHAASSSSTDQSRGEKRKYSELLDCMNAVNPTHHALSQAEQDDASDGEEIAQLLNMGSVSAPVLPPLVSPLYGPSAGDTFGTTQTGHDRFSESLFSSADNFLSCMRLAHFKTGDMPSVFWTHFKPIARLHLAMNLAKYAKASYDLHEHSHTVDAALIDSSPFARETFLKGGAGDPFSVYDLQRVMLAKLFSKVSSAGVFSATSEWINDLFFLVNLRPNQCVCALILSAYLKGNECITSNDAAERSACFERLKESLKSPEYLFRSLECLGLGCSFDEGFVPSVRAHTFEIFSFSTARMMDENFLCIHQVLQIGITDFSHPRLAFILQKLYNDNPDFYKNALCLTAIIPVNQIGIQRHKDRLHLLRYYVRNKFSQHLSGYLSDYPFTFQQLAVRENPHASVISDSQAEIGLLDEEKDELAAAALFDGAYDDLVVYQETQKLTPKILTSLKFLVEDGDLDCLYALSILHATGKDPLVPLDMGKAKSLFAKAMKSRHKKSILLLTNIIFRKIFYCTDPALRNSPKIRRHKDMLYRLLKMSLPKLQDNPSELDTSLLFLGEVYNDSVSGNLGRLSAATIERKYQIAAACYTEFARRKGEKDLKITLQSIFLPR